MNQYVKTLGAAAFLVNRSTSILNDVRALQAARQKNDEIRAVARVTRDYGASRPVLELSHAVESLISAEESVLPSLEGFDVIPARKSDARTVSVVEACDAAIATESSGVSAWMLSTKDKLSTLFEGAYEAMSDMADLADGYATALEAQLVDPVLLQSAPYSGIKASASIKALESAVTLAEQLSNLDDAALATEAYQNACKVGFESFADSAILKSRGLVLKNGSLEALCDVGEDLVSGSLESAGYNAPDAVSALRVGAKACRALSAMLDNRVAMASCLEYGASAVPAAESIDGVPSETGSLHGVQTLVGNYATITSQLIAGVCENMVSAITAADALKTLI